MTYYRVTCTKATYTVRPEEVERDAAGNKIFHRDGFTVTFFAGYVKCFDKRYHAQAYVHNWGGPDYWTIEAVADSE